MTANDGERRVPYDVAQKRASAHAADSGDDEHAAPRAIVLHAASRVLELDWGDDSRPDVQRISTAALRAACPCSACERQRIDSTHAPGSLAAADADNAAASAVTDAVTDATTDAATVTAVELVGTYALHIRFADGHDRGIYPWSYLRGLVADDA